MSKNKPTRGERLDLFPSITPETIRFHGLAPMKVIKGRIIRRSATGSFIFISDDGRLSKPSLYYGTSVSIDRPRIAESQDDAELKMLVKLGAITAKEARESLKALKDSREHQDWEESLRALEVHGANLGVSASIKGITRELRKTKAAMPAK